ncbi:MAG TPA: hypothetical protein ENN87_07530 [Phycisphaerales bacterium]|nr:hypothetical protein [Phycisphaerales bacterium]
MREGDRDRRLWPIGATVCCLTAWVAAGVNNANEVATIALNVQADGYRGIWYMNQPSNDEYVYKYSGGLGTYCAKHRPFAVYRPQVDKTFFCYGGATAEDPRHLLHMVSYYDHKTGCVPRPTVLLDKQTEDAHDNPVLNVDDEGFVWVFSTSHGRSRPSYIHRSRMPYSVAAFEPMAATYSEGGQDVSIDNFSYMQAWYEPGWGFVCFFTRYSDPAARTNYFMTSRDGVHWSNRRRLAAMEQGHYQISALGPGRAGTMFNYHPQGKGLNWRTNLYYMETRDHGRTWTTVDGRELDVPLTDPACAALVRDYETQGLNVYLKDLVYDDQGRPILLYVTSKGYQSGPQNDPRMWTMARWTGNAWDFMEITTSDNNYDMGSLYPGGPRWRLIAPTLTGPQPYNPGGEVALWISQNAGRTWRLDRQMTRDSAYNHTYIRRPVGAHPDFYAFWADGHARQPSESRLYFATRDGRVFMLPTHMQEAFAQPVEVGVGSEPVGQARLR